MIKTSEKSKITNNFTLKEYAYGIFENQITKLGEEIVIYPESYLHASILQEFREWYGKGMTVNAWVRMPKFNKQMGGASNSGHLFGKATDISMTINEKTFKQYRDKWFALCNKHNCIGAIGWYSNFVHFESYVNWARSNVYWKQIDGKTSYNF